MSTTETSRALLVDLLHEAAQLEHTLLNAYLYTACSLKSTPQELATDGGAENPRRAIQFERIRSWKQAILQVAVEEMIHLHYVQCLLRALGEPPTFALPGRDADGSWIIPAWRARIGQEPVDGGEGVTVPLQRLTPTQMRRFVLYESTDALQDADPFGETTAKLFKDLYDLELELRLEGMLLDEDDEAVRARLKASLSQLYAPKLPPEQAVALASAELPQPEELHFQSIADFYRQGILPLYRQAFDFGWVRHNNLDLNFELQDADPQEGLLGIGPVYRDKNFQAEARANLGDPLRNFKSVDDIVSEIVDEGEGATDFAGRARRLLDTVAARGGPRGYLQALAADRAAKGTPTPPDLADAEVIRQSHLYRFAAILTELEQERELTGPAFEPSRQPLDAEQVPLLADLAAELPQHFNACYLVLTTWLARIYELRGAAADRPRRIAIEMMATWPMMSVAIRPLLELASFLPIDPRQLFRLDADGLPLLPIHARQLHQLASAPERSEELNDQMDYFALRTLTDVAAWAGGVADQVAEADLAPAFPEGADVANAQTMMVTRLRELAHLDEFERQFPFRVAGGWSNRAPSAAFMSQYPDAADFEEDAQNAKLRGTLALRLRFAGRAQAQMATDPDPPSDESGCTGTCMLHAADGDRRLNRALVWQDTDPERTIRREPRDELPDVAVNLVDLSLVVPDGFRAFPEAINELNSTGAVQTSGVQWKLAISGLNDLLTLGPRDVLGDGREVRVQLLPKDGTWPYYNGYNHLSWKDGEPIDPFVLAVLADGESGAPELLFQREVFNRGTPFMEMSPLQRVLSTRGGLGLTIGEPVPEWVVEQLSPRERALLADPRYPIAYLEQRAGVLVKALGEALPKTGDVGGLTREQVDAVISLAERLKLFTQPRGTTIGWLTAMLHHGHSVSGPLTAGTGDDPLLAALRERTGLTLALHDGGADRSAANARWVVRYTEGVMDTDALSHVVYGDLIVPVDVVPGPDPVRFAWRWSFAPGTADAVAGYACRFDAPFWASFEVTDGVRRTNLPNGTPITETLGRHDDAGYDYAMTGVAGVEDYAGSFAVTVPDDASGRPVLEWSISFACQDAATIVSMASVLAGAAAGMTTALAARFGPSVDPPVHRPQTG